MTEYIVRHWRGQFPLAQSCWLNGLLALLPFFVWFELIGDYLVAHPPVRPVAFLIAFGPAFLIFVVVNVWAGVGIWRSSGRRILFGHLGWAWLARAAVVLNFVVLLLAAILLVNKAQAMLWPTRSTQAPYEVTLRGTTAVFRGRIDAAAVDELELLLNDKSVRRLAIAASDGGERGPVLRLARLVHARKLFVVALSECDAACTVLLAAGGARAAIPQTVISFAAATPDELALYRQAGLAGPLLESLRNLQSGAAYEPALRTLIENRFLTDIFVDTTRRYVRAPGWCAKNLVACARTGRQNRDLGSGKGGNGDGA